MDVDLAKACNLYNEGTAIDTDIMYIYIYILYIYRERVSILYMYTRYVWLITYDIYPYHIQL
jgi:hypothetical protein